MRIPLDYYRILGLPVQASQELLEQAYRDRAMQLPRREYSDPAINARKQLLDAAYTVLSEPQQRSLYDASYLAVYHPEADSPSQDTTRDSSQLLTFVDPHTPSIEIPPVLFAGALLILQELGEYELVVNLGRQYLRSSVGTDSNSDRSDLPDVVLTLALACLELGREQWQQGQYENAAASLENGRELLLREKLFLSVQGEILSELAKLRPYRILELLVQPEENQTQRQQGLKLLRQLLEERGGIDGTGEDGSGLGLDDFLQFMQQLRRYLSVAEQQDLFDRNSSASAVTSYLAVYASIAQGFAQRMPGAITRAKLLLLRLGQHQDLYLEQAICSLLLGQTEQISGALQQSHEHEALAFIREHSQDSPDLLPGLCLYTERWLQTEVFPYFRDLAEKQAILKDYFADRQVQAYLEALPVETEVTTDTELSSEPQLPSQPNYHLLLKQRLQDQSQEVPNRHKTSDRTTTISSSTSLDGIPAAARTQYGINDRTDPPVDITPTANQQPRLKKRRRRSSDAIAPSQSSVRGSLSNFSRRVLSTRYRRLILLIVAALLSLAVLGLIVQFLRRPSRQNVPPLLSTSPVQSPSPIPQPSANPLAVVGWLTREQAQVVIQTWLSTKGAAFGPSHSVDQLKQILVDPALSQWQQLAQNNKADNQYLKYNERGIKVDSVKATKANPNQAEVEATVNEAAEVYRDGKLNRELSYDKSLRVRYRIIRQGDLWRIAEINS